MSRNSAMRVGAPLGCEEFARMRLERHHTERQAAGIRGGTGAGEQRLVAAMHTVEIADGERAGRPAFGVGQAAEDFHEDGGLSVLGKGGIIRRMGRLAPLLGADRGGQGGALPASVDFVRHPPAGRGALRQKAA